jgi:hypothetical protein
MRWGAHPVHSSSFGNVITLGQRLTAVVSLSLLLGCTTVGTGDRTVIRAEATNPDLLALERLSGFAEIGVHLGTDFRLVGFDDIEECARLRYRSHLPPATESRRLDATNNGRSPAPDLCATLFEKQPIKQWVELVLQGFANCHG